jgi:hypothetical protein
MNKDTSEGSISELDKSRISFCHTVVDDVINKENIRPSASKKKLKVKRSSRKGK